VEFEPTIAVLERAKTVRALDRSATAIGHISFMKSENGPLALENKMSLLHQFWTIYEYGVLMERYMSREGRGTRMETCSDAASYATNPT
jgi:hypothetical protein